MTIFRSSFLVACVYHADVSAALYDRGNGMIYDDVLDITWLQDASFAQTSGFDPTGQLTFDNAKSWAESLNISGYNDWRLPIVSNPNIPDDDYQTLYGRDYIGEMGHLYFVTLGNEGQLVNPDCVLGPTGCLTNTSFIDPSSGETVSFINMFNDGYWYDELATDIAVEAEVGYSFTTVHGIETNKIRGNNRYGDAWAVRDGDVTAVPIPAAFVFYITSLFSYVSINYICNISLSEKAVNA